MLRDSIICLLILLLSIDARAQSKQGPADHGRVMACCLDVFPHKLKDTTKIEETKNYVFRGKVISLGKDKNVSICYDVEHLRVAGAWVGKPFIYSADKNMGPTVEGEMLFSTRPGPGWAKDGKWDDPRDGREGPLPRDWAHYKGLYVHGDRVVLAYTVGSMEVLEMPEVVEQEGVLAISRIFEFGPNARPSTMLVCEEPTPIIRNPGDPQEKSGEVTAVSYSAKDGKDSRVTLQAQGIATAQFEFEGQRVLLKLPALPNGGKLRLTHARGPANRKPAKIGGAESVSTLTRGGPARWTQTLESAVTPGDAKGPYALDQIAVPEKNPWNASIRFAGLDFFADGRAALSTWDGDVWIVSGLNANGNKASWKRFASGLQQPLGLKVIEGHIYTAGRDQITKLHDLNNDGEADYYENLNNEAGLTLQRHEFVMDLQADKDGNLYFCRSGHYIQSKRLDNCCIYRMSPDGKNLEKFATGFREPNGISIGPDGTMTVADNEGNGIPQTPLYRLLPGKDYGFLPPAPWKKFAGEFKLREQPIVWLGPKVDTSAGGQVWAPTAERASDRKGWGPLAGQLLHTSYGNCALFAVLIDKSAEPWQGAVWKFPFAFNSGIMRARFNPADGQLYVCGLRGWGTSGVRDGQFARIRATGNDLPIPVGYRVVKGGIELTFSAPLDKASAEDEDNWAGTWSNVLKKVPTAKEMQEMPIVAVRLGPDRKVVTVALERTRIVPNFTLQYRLKAAGGAPVQGDLHGTIHRVP